MQAHCQQGQKQGLLALDRRAKSSEGLELGLLKTWKLDWQSPDQFPPEGRAQVETP